MRQAASRERSTPCTVTCFATAVLQDVRARSRDAEEDDDQPSVFDAPDGEPDCIFVNPFACGVSPLQWRELQVGLVLLKGTTKCICSARGSSVIERCLCCCIPCGPESSTVGSICRHHQLHYNMLTFNPTSSGC